MAELRAGFLLLALPWAALLGCGSVKEKIATLEQQHRPAIERNLAAWPAIERQLRQAPPLARSGLVGAPALVADALVGSDGAANAALCYAEDLADPDELGFVWGRIPGTGALNHCASLLHRGHYAYDPEKADRRLAGKSLAETRWRYPRCAGYRYLLAIRTLEFLPPSPATPATEPFVPVDRTLDLDKAPPPAARPSRAPTTARETLLPEQRTEDKRITRYRFEGGLLRGEVLVFELPSAKLLGGYHFSAQSTVQVEGTDEAIRSDFATQVKQAVAKVLATKVAGGGKP